MKNLNNTEFDFDDWMNLGKKDPKAFEEKRQQLIKSTIDDAPERLQRRLKGLQWSVDCKIESSKTPMESCLKIYQMMMDSIYEPDGLLDALTMANNANKPNDKKNIINFNNEY